MGVGVTQPGGVGTTIMIEDDNSAPNGLWYTEANYAAAFPADFVPLGTTPESYRSKVSIQNGDGTGSAKTTWKGTRSTIHFDAGKTYIVSATGRINRFTEWGSVVVGPDGEPVGYDGLEIFFGADTTISGNYKLYGCELRNPSTPGIAGRILFLPSVVGTFCELVDTDVFTTHQQGYGNATQKIDRIRRLTAAGSGVGLASGIVQFNCPDADTVTISFPNGQRKMATAGAVTMRRVRFIGPSTECDARLTAGAQFIEPTWSKACVKSTLNTIEEWEPFTQAVYAGAAAVAAAGALVEVIDVLGRLVCSAITDANGQISYTGPISPILGAVPGPNCILVYGPNGLGSMREYGPFIKRISKAGYPTIEQKVHFPSTPFQTVEKEFTPINASDQLKDPADTVNVSYYRESEIQNLLAEFGQPVSIGADTTLGIVERNTIGVAEGRDTAALGIEVSIQIETDSLPGLAIGVAISADGVTYKVQDFKQIGDGALTRIKVALEA